MLASFIKIAPDADKQWLCELDAVIKARNKRQKNDDAIYEELDWLLKELYSSINREEWLRKVRAQLRKENEALQAEIQALKAGIP